MSRTQGRHLQAVSMKLAATDRKLGFLVCKAIDGMPKVNATPQLVAARVSRFLSGRPQQCYGPIESAGALLARVQERSILESAWIPKYALDHYLLIVDVFESAHNAPLGVISEPKPGERSLGPHCVYVTGCSDDGEVLTFWNSWGSSWGRGGNGEVSKDYVRSHYQESWTGWSAKWGPHPLKPDMSTLLANPKELRRVWLIENWRFRYRIPGCRQGDSWYLECFVTVSRGDGQEMQVIEIRNGFGLRLGWAFVCHDTDRRVSEIRELFVMPAFRHQGVGSCLEGVSAEQAEEYGSRDVHLVMNNSDSVVGPPRRTAREFGIRRGYSWRWREVPRLRAVAIGVKALSTS
jgi:GNAT superfamily N-acetyltransferase